MSVAAATVAAGISAGVAFAATSDPSSGQVANRAAANGAAVGKLGQSSADHGSSSQADRAGGAAASGQETNTQASQSQSNQGQAAHAQPPQKAAAPKHIAPYLIYDSLVPWKIPSGKKIATYATGAHPVPASAVAGRGPVLWIDTLGTDPKVPVLDVEPGCAPSSIAAGWVTKRLSAQPGAVAIIYTSISQWPTLQADIATLPARMRSHVRWWIADPTGVPHVVPGSNATQWYWGSGYDISTALPNFEGLSHEGGAACLAG
jgi:hypothetical protein